MVSEEYGSGIVQSECFDAINFKFQALSKINDDISYVSTEFEKHKRHSQVLFMALESLLQLHGVKCIQHDPLVSERKKSLLTVKLCSLYGSNQIYANGWQE